MGKILKNFLTGDFKPYFLVQENYGIDSNHDVTGKFRMEASEVSESAKYPMDITIILKMCDTGVFDLQQPIEIHTAAKSNLTRISLCLEDKAFYENFAHDFHLSISGFPREIVASQVMKPLPTPPVEDDDLREPPSESSHPRASSDSVASAASKDTRLGLIGGFFRKTQSINNLKAGGSGSGSDVARGKRPATGGSQNAADRDDDALHFSGRASTVSLVTMDGRSGTPVNRQGSPSRSQTAEVSGARRPKIHGFL